VTTASSAAPRSRTRTTVAITVVVLAVLVIAFFIFSNLYSDWLWFQQLGFLEVLTTQWWAAIGMFAVGFLGMAVPVFAAVEIAYRARPVMAKLSSQLDRYQQVIEPLRRLAMWGVPAVLGLFMGVSTAMHWQTIAQYVNRTSFGTKDPQFHLDASFYIYELPFYHGLLGYASAAVIVALIATAATCYLYGGIRVINREVRITRSTRIQLAITAAIYLALQAVSIFLDQYSTVTDPNGISSNPNVGTGATYADVAAVIPGRAILAGIAAIVAVLFLVTAVIGRWRFPLIGTALLIVSTLVVGTLYPAIVQKLTVEPSEQTLERQYIQRNIDATRKAYGVDDVKTVSYAAATDATQGALRSDAETTANLRILDPNVVSKTFAQLQQQVQYYGFPDHLDVDRYDIDGKTQDTVLAVRELDQSGQSAGGWYNDTLVYTHGYGVVAAYGNQQDEKGQPVFLEENIPTTGKLGEYEPRVYFGEGSPSYSIVGQKKATGSGVEIDYPGGKSASNAKKTTYTGNGGPKLDSWFNRLVYAVKFQSQEILLSQDVGDKSQILYNRDPIQRVEKAAPYLTADNDAYPAVVDGRIVWIVDAYTTTSDYPYSQVEQLGDAVADTNVTTPNYSLDSINYIRNSVKATVDAYSGKVTLYQWDTKDPILNTWKKIYPGTLKPKSDMSKELLEHVRYPSDLFKMQRDILGAYHVTNPDTFFSGDDKWATPADPTKTGSTKQPPYYLTMQVPGTDKPAFTLYSTFIPQSQADDKKRDILKGYLTADSDAGDGYGKLTLLTLPKDPTVAGPGQAQTNFNADATVSSFLNLLKQGDTETVRGNLLTVPIGGGLLYLQPVYVQSKEGTQYPLLQKVLAGFGDKIAFEDTLDAALDSLFGGDSGATAGDAGVDDGGGGTGTGGGTGSGGGTGTGTGTGSGSTADNAALQSALDDYQSALDDRTQAYKDGDLVAAAEADQKMQDAVTRAIAATQG